MQVRDLAEAIARHRELTVTAPLGDFEVDDEAASITVHVEGTEDMTFGLDESAEAAVAKYLRIPRPYLKSCPPDFRAQTLRYWLHHYRDADTVVEAVNGELVSMHSPSQLTIPLQEVGRVVTTIFDPDDAVALLRDDRRAEINVTSERFAIEVPNPHRVPGRPRVGDLVKGGIRLLSYPTQAKAPAVLSYAERLICSNGMVSDEKLGQISLKGRTVDEVIAEMEDAARRLLGEMPQRLEDYAHTAEVRPPGNALAFAEQLAREYNLSRRILDQVFDTINQIPGDLITLYDIQNAFTAVANEDGISMGTRNRLQHLGGYLGFQSEEALQRCGACERLI